MISLNEHICNMTGGVDERLLELIRQKMLGTTDLTSIYWSD